MATPEVSKTSECNIVHLWDTYKSRLKKDVSRTIVDSIENGKDLTSVQKSALLKHVAGYLKSDELYIVLNSLLRLMEEEEGDILSSFSSYSDSISEIKLALDQYLMCGGRIVPSILNTYLLVEHLIYFLEKQGKMREMAKRYKLNISEGTAVASFLGLESLDDLKDLDEVTTQLEALLEKYFDEKIKLSDDIYKYIEKVCRGRVLQAKKKYPADR